MAPELMAGSKCNQSVDIYSFGILLHEIASGVPLVALYGITGLDGLLRKQSARLHAGGQRGPCSPLMSLAAKESPLQCWCLALIARCLGILQNIMAAAPWAITVTEQVPPLASSLCHTSPVD
jgi:hypothetical protein